MKLFKSFTFFLLFVFVLTSCGDKNNKAEFNSAAREYISSYTGGEISKKSEIVVEFADAVVNYSQVNKELGELPISFTPEIEGKAVWVNVRTLVITPSKLLNSGETYLGSINLRSLIPSISDTIGNFEFNFKVKSQSFDVEYFGIQNVVPELLEWQSLSGKVSTYDFELPQNVEDMFKASIGGNELVIKWTHNGNGLEHLFLVDSIKRTNDQQQLVFERDGGVFNSEQRFDILALGDFKLISAIGFNGDDQHIVFQFSDPLKKNQDLDGLIRVGDNEVTYVIEGNVVKVFPKIRLIGSVSLIVEPGVLNIVGHKLQNRANNVTTFKEIKPQVRLKGKGTIIPGTSKLPFVFEAVNLSAVDVRIIRIHEKNVPQFLQVNNLPQSRELKRVGHLIAMKKIELGSNSILDLKSWNVHSLDLSKIIKPQPGAIYEISLGYRRSYSLYTCTDSSTTSDSPSMLAVDASWGAANVVEEEDSYWDYYEEEPQDNNWENRNNPCMNAFYSTGKSVSRNVLASTIGLTAKMGDNGDFFVAATDINSAKPLSNVILELYNYQQHIIKKVTTGPSGIANFKVDGQPFLMVAKIGKERGYLKLDDGNSLPMSRFDISGKNFKQGLKGFIYTERGVWRPGDSLFINLILEDKLNVIPENYPVIFEMFNPSGQLVSKIVNRNDVNGFYAFHTKTEEDATTGNYLAKIRVGGVVFSKTLKIETIVPNRLKLKLDFDFEYLSEKTVDEKSELSVIWLHGAIAGNLDAEVKVTLSPLKTTFKRFSDYIFDDPSKAYFAEQQTLFKGKLDENGKAEIPANISVNKAAPGMLLASFKGTAFEPGGNFSVDRFSLPYSPYNTYVGLKVPKGDKARGMLLTDTNHLIKIATVNPSGDLVKGRKVAIFLYKLEWKWWWDKSAYKVNYNGRYFSNPLLKDSITTINGEATWAMRINYPEWGRYLLKVCDEDGHCAAKIIYMDWPGWAGRGEKEKGAGSNMLSFTSNKKKYKVGEQVTLNIPTGANGRALLTIEDGDKVIESHWINATKGTTQFTFKATAKMAPNVYAHISLLQPHAQTKNDLPIRLYGVIPILIENENTVLQPIIRMPDVLEPESSFKIKVSEKNNKAMTYTIALVDEGLLDLTRFKTPNPWSYFYQRKSLNIRTWDLFDEIMGAQSEKINSLLSIGGDGEGSGGKGGSKQNRFKPVVQFIGPFYISAGKTNEHTLTIPNYIGSVKAMVVAGNKRAYGFAHKAVPVKKPLMALASLPRILSPGEDVTLPVTIFSLDEKIKNVNIKVEGNSLIEVIDPSAQKMTFNKIGDQVINFNLKVKNAIGNGEVKVTATSGKEKAVYYVDVKVRAPNPAVVNVYQSEVGTNKSWKAEYNVFGMDKTNTTTIEVSSVPPLNLGKRLKYLIQYPHGCIEQTTSSVFPQLYLNKLVKLPADRKRQIDRNVKAGISRLRSFQRMDGGMSYWPGSGSADEWGTNYAGNFLLEAKRAGYNVPDEMLESWVVFQTKKAKTWANGNEGSELTQAYRLYLLALGDSPEMGSMNRLRLKKSLSPLAKWYLASAYKMAVRPEIANELIKGLPMSVSLGNNNGTYGSALRNEAIILQSLSILGKRNDASKMAMKISNKLDNEEWYSTQTTAFCLVAMAKYIGTSSVSKQLNFSYRRGTGSWVKVTSSNPIWQHSFPELKKGDKSLSIKNGDVLLFAKVLVEGTPLVGDGSDASNGIELSNKFFDLEGEELSILELKQGLDFISEITIKNTGTDEYVNMALTYMLPSGWEIHNGRLDGNSYNTSIPTYQDYRDDRVNFYYNIKPNETKTFSVSLNATYLGKYYLPTIYTEAMYNNSINARVHGYWVNITK